MWEIEDVLIFENFEGRIRKKLILIIIEFIKLKV